MAEPSSTQSYSAQQLFQKIAANYEKHSGGVTRIIARHLVGLIPSLEANATILDNACGPGIVIDELLASINNEAVKESINVTAVDSSPAMIDLLKAKAKDVWDIPADHVSAMTLAAEDLDSLPTDTYDYSFTNFGFMFFKDPSTAAGHVFRTLKPGGTAYITTWADLGHMRAVYAAAEAVRPDLPRPKLPFGDEWFDPGHLQKLCSEAGFTDVQVSQKDSAWRGASLEKFAQSMTEVFGGMMTGQGWSNEDVGKMTGEIMRAYQENKHWLKYDEKDGSVESKSVANVAVCRK